MAAAVPNDVPATKMESYLTCSICLETLKDPRTLACYHSFCKSCLTKFVKGQRENAEGKIVEEFNCPECRTVFQLNKGRNVEEMPRNHFVSNMLEVLAIQRRPNEIPCNSCELKPPAVSRCTTCEQYLCRTCLTAHGNWPAFKEHIVFNMDELVKPENQAKIKGKFRCTKHENKSFKFYCETCKELVCTHCIVLEHKDGHSCLLAVKVGEKKRELLKSSSDFLNNQLKEGNDLMQNIDHVTQQLKNNAVKAKDEISQQKLNILKAFTEKLEEKAKLLKNEVDNKYNEIHEALLKQKADVKAYLDKVKGPLELTKNLLEKGTHEEILSIQNEIEENVKKVKSERPTGVKPVHDGNIHYKANALDNIDTTSNLNKMGVVISNLIPTDPQVLNVCNTSTILNGHNEYGKQVVEWLGGQFQWRLYYRASTHGWSAQDFHRNCDNKGPTVTLVKVKDHIFGGYTDQNWAGHGWKQSNSSFLFSLKNKDNIHSFKASVYQNLQHAIRSHPRYGPTFGGGHDLYISNNAHTNQQSYSNFGDTYQPPEGYVYKSEQTKSLLAGSHKFTPTEIEVFY